jgi:cell wall-associated NlpC family hydrolase
MKKNKKSHKIKKKYRCSAFLLLFLLVGVTVFFFALQPHGAFAQTTYQSQEKIPGAGGQATDAISYIKQIIGFGYAVIGILAMFMLCIGAYQYLMAAGNLSKAESAKNSISSALLGLLLGLMSWIILYAINPDLVTITGPNLSAVNFSYTSPGNTGLPGGTTPGGGTITGNGSGGRPTGTTGLVSSGNATIDQIASKLQAATTYVNYDPDHNPNGPQGWVGDKFYGDCSSWAQEFYKEAYGIDPGRSTAAMLSNANGSTDMSTLKPGDLLITTGGGSTGRHASIYIGDGKVISNQGTNLNVRVSDVNEDKIIGVIKAPS